MADTWWLHTLRLTRGGYAPGAERRAAEANAEVGALRLLGALLQRQQRRAVLRRARRTANLIHPLISLQAPLVRSSRSATDAEGLLGRDHAGRVQLAHRLHRYSGPPSHQPASPKDYVHLAEGLSPPRRRTKSTPPSPRMPSVRARCAPPLSAKRAGPRPPRPAPAAPPSSPRASRCVQPARRPSHAAHPSPGSRRVPRRAPPPCAPLASRRPPSLCSSAKASSAPPTSRAPSARPPAQIDDGDE